MPPPGLWRKALTCVLRTWVEAESKKLRATHVARSASQSQLDRCHFCGMTAPENASPPVFPLSWLVPYESTAPDTAVPLAVTAERPTNWPAPAPVATRPEPLPMTPTL